MMEYEQVKGLLTIYMKKMNIFLMKKLQRGFDISNTIVTVKIISDLIYFFSLIYYYY